MIGRALAADTAVLASAAAGRDRHREESLDSVVTFIERGSHQTGVTVETQRELRQIVGTNREAIENVEELIREERVARDLAHHVDLQAILTLLQTMGSHDRNSLLRFIDRAAERDHQLNVGETHFITDALHGEALELKALGERIRDVAGSTAEAEHRILFHRLEELAADQLAVFVALEVGHADDHLAGIERGGNGRNAFSDLADVELARIRVAGRETLDGVTELARNVRVLKAGLRMHADVVVDDELETGKTNTLRRDLLELESELRIADVHHDLHGDLGESALLHFFHVEVKLALVDVARIAFGAGHRHFLILSEEFGRVAAANHSRNTGLTGNNSRVAGTAAAVRHDGGGTAHHGFPVGVRHIGHEHVTRLHAIHFLCGQNDADGARSDLLTNGTAGHKSLGTLAVDRELFLDVSLVLAALNRFRTGLQNVDLAVDTVLAPLDIHRAAVVLLDLHRLLRQLLHLLVG